ncbi:LPS export ABC transporter periplasmic protein LptC [Vibrio tapetis]|uniref:Lipopolysaccharide export system protein LptC n=1 Tax=Vibrio tapetis subsp. tapetis TaxID=1671868 RepID=A0A2N8ZFL4_9VIBR|nr:LPS export ABC transporter periplasmic protein LptC [Vibrio tapetis]SON50655.1 conserved protein of unknown function [Vibrio tapetis subsp. tapetis]
MTLPHPIYLLLFFVSCWSAYYLYDHNNKEVIQVVPDVELPVFSGRTLTNTSYNQAGIRNFEIKSKYLEHFSKNGETIFEQLKLSVFRSGHTEEWTVTANKGVMDSDYQLELTGNVLVKNVLPNSGFDTLSTEKLVIQLQSKDFHTNLPVTLFGPQFTTEGQAMKGNFDRNTATLFNQVQGKYETVTP